MNYQRAINLLEAQELPLEIPTLGGNNLIIVELLEDGQIQIGYGAQGNSFTFNSEYWYYVVNRYMYLMHLGLHKNSQYYQMQMWSNEEGNINAIHSPYIAALVLYLASL